MGATVKFTNNNRTTVTHDVMAILATCKNEEDAIENEGARVVTRFSQL